jgi:hypothetical protein
MPCLGQLVSYMRNFKLKYGFLSTYRSTVFCRRVNNFRFELSLPKVYIHGTVDILIAAR